MAKKVILDVDTGSDDAVAIMEAVRCPALDVVGICTVWGNLDVKYTTENTLRLLDALGRKDIPVYKGVDTAMVKYLDQTRPPKQDKLSVVDENGKELRGHYQELEGLKPTDKKPEKMDAVTFYITYLRAATEKITLIPVGPLTNLGHALSIAPDIVDKIEEIMIMGGGDSIANISECAEANIWHDPEAAEIVAQCGAPVLWIPLDATHSAPLGYEESAKLRECNTFASNYAALMIEQRTDFGRAAHGSNNTALHDALAVAAVIDRSVLTNVLKCNVHIGLRGYGEGETIIDRRCIPDEANCEFALTADKDKFLAMLCEYLGKE